MKQTLSIDDLVPREATFSLSTKPGVTLTLCPWSLRVRTWAVNKYTAQGVDAILRERKGGEVADIVFFMLKEKTLFNYSLDEFMDNIRTTKDHYSLFIALAGSLGIAEPQIEQLAKAVENAADPKAPPQKKKKAVKTGAKSSTR